MQEINDLKNVVIQSLESHGVLSQLRAQIRASVFKIIEEQESKDSKNNAFFWENPLCQKIHDSRESKIGLELMHEFMEFYRMDYTSNIFINESNFQGDSERNQLAKKLNIGQNLGVDKPLLAIIIEKLLPALSQTEVEEEEVQPQQSERQNLIDELKKANEAFKKKSEEEIQVLKSDRSLGDKLEQLNQVKKEEIETKEKAVFKKVLKIETDNQEQSPLPSKQEAPPHPSQSREESDFDDQYAEEFEEEFDQEDIPQDGAGIYVDENGEPLSTDEMYTSESHGYAFSVDSLAIEQFDYVEDVIPPA